MARPKKRWALRVLLSLIGLLAVLAGAAFAFQDPILRYFIKREATARGVDLEFGDMRLGRGFIRLEKVRLSLLGVRGLDADIETARVSFDYSILPRDVTRIEAKSVTVRALGSVADRALEVSAWSKEHPDAFRVPVSATEIRVEWREKKGAPPWLSLAGGALASPASGGGGTFRATDAQLSGIGFGPTFASWTATRSAISLGFGKESPADAPIRIDIQPAPLPASVLITLRPVTMADLGSPMGLSLPTDKAKVEGTAKLTLGERPAEEPIAGTVAMTLQGWVPPHPKELGGIIFGDKTTFTSAFLLSKDRSQVALTDSAVAAGAFKLKGSGSIDRKGDYALASMDMKGSIACADVARSAAASNFGSAVGTFVGDIARRAMEGSVAVSVHIDADTRDLDHPRIKNDVGVGCGLKGLPQLLPKLPSASDLPKLPDIPLPEIRIQ